MFKVNQTVWCAICGKGVVAKVVQEDEETYPIRVKFNNSLSNSYTSDGKHFSGGNVVLFPYPVEIVKAVTKPSIDWSHVSEDFKYLAMDNGGLHHLFTEKPLQATLEWVTHHPYVFAGHFASFTPGTCDWKDSLVERPE